MVAATIEDWDGPSDLDLGGYDDGLHTSPDEEASLNSRYVQTAFAAVYAAEANDKETIASAHRILIRAASLAGFESLPDLQDETDHLPSFHKAGASPQELPNAMLAPDALLHNNHMLTAPNEENFSLLRFCILSASILAELGYPISVVNVAKLRFQLDKDEQLGILQKVFHVLLTGSRKTEEEWLGTRKKVLWLWAWGEGHSSGNSSTGVFGKVRDSIIEEEFIKAFISAACQSTIKILHS
jgi:hypothetical protein